MQIHEANLKDKKRWNSFIKTHNGSIFHYFEWKDIYELKNWKYIPLLIENDKSHIFGVLPIVKIGYLGYSKLISLPEGASGGFVLKKGITKDEQSQVVEMFLNYIGENYSKDCSTFSLRQNLENTDKSASVETEILDKNGFTPIFNEYTKLPCTHILNLKKDFESNIWYGLWKKDIRNHIRKANKNGVSVIEDKTLQYKDDYYKMLSETYKRLGSEPLSLEEFNKRLILFNKNSKVFVAFFKNKPIGFMLCNYANSTCYASKMGYYDLARRNHVNNLLMYQTIKYACENDYKFFEFGLTFAPSSEAWKNQFMGIKEPLRIYEKRYSIIRYIPEMVIPRVMWMSKNKKYLFKNWYKILNKKFKNHRDN